MKIVTHYDSLGVSRNAPAEVIRAAYKALAQKNHPDKNIGNPQATNLMQTINQAYDVLSDPQKREDYDAWLSRQELEALEPVQHEQPHTRQNEPRQNYPYPLSRQPKRAAEVFVVLALIAGAICFIFFNYMSYKPPIVRNNKISSPVIKEVSPQTVAGKDKSSAPETTTQQQLAACVFSAAQTYNVPPAIILSIISAEGGVVGQRVRVAANTYDLGLLRINSSWIPALSKLWVVNQNTALHMLREDACINIGVGAWILHSVLAQGGSLQNEISHYHTASHHLSGQVNDAAYVDKVMKLIDVYKYIHSPEDLLDQSPVSPDKQ